MSRHRLLQPAPVALLSLAAAVALLLADVVSLARFREARAYAEVALPVQDRSLNVSRFLQKPFRFEKLLEAIEHLVERGDASTAPNDG